MQRWLAIVLLTGAMLTGRPCVAQEQAAPPSAPTATVEKPYYHDPVLLLQPCVACDEKQDADARGAALRFLPRNLLQDQLALLNQPLRMRARQWSLGLPLVFLATGLVATDTAVEGHVTKSALTASRANTFSNAGLAALAGAGGTMYLWGRATKNERLSETGLLSGEAAIDAFADTGAIKLITGRDRPFTANRRGGFLNGGSSFPSQHSAVSWAIASVIAHEYPGTMTKLLSYGLAGAVSAARVEAHQHFLSDSLIGGAIGWYIGRQVYRARSGEAEINPRSWGRFLRDENAEEDERAAQMGSAYVPPDSWVYPALDRLIAMGAMPQASVMMRPLTRLRCARLVQDAQEAMAEEAFGLEAGRLLDELAAEFAHEGELLEGGTNRGATVESIYARFTGIAGTPLRDSFHFAQTMVDDEGRPYGEGANLYAGVSGRAERGALALYLRGEVQYASAIAPYSAAVQQTIAAYDRLPYGWAERAGTTSRFKPIEAYVALNVSNWQFSLGQQSLWWGPDRSTSMILSNNTEALPMLRLARVQPLRLGLLGAMHLDGFIGREGGIHYVGLGTAFTLYGTAAQVLTPPPYIWGINLSLKPTDNLELGVAHTTIFAGYGRPLNLKTFVHSLSILGNGQAVDPGKRVTEFNFSYRLPGLRRWVVFYTEATAYDNPVEGKFKSRYAFDPGLYLPRLPGLAKMDLRVEGAYTNLPGLVSQAYFYSNAHYPQGYTNYGQILGSWVGRQGVGGVARANYWLSPRSRVSVSYRQMAVDNSLLQGGRLSDLSGGLTWMLRPGLELTATSQLESWNFPLLATQARTNTATTLGLRMEPGARKGK